MSIWLNGVDLAKELKITKGRVSQLKTAGIFRISLDKKFDLNECRKNFKELRSNAPRIDPSLPFDSAPVEEFKDDVKALRTAARAGDTSAHKQYIIAKAARETYRAKKEKLEYEALERELVNSVMINAALLEVTSKDYSQVKSMIVSIPKGAALKWPNPKERPLLETILNGFINNILACMAEFDLVVDAVDEKTQP